MDERDGKTTVPEDHHINEEDLLITIGQFVNFLQDRNRSTICPLCGHEGEWIIHGGDIRGESEFLHIYALLHPAGRGFVLPAIMMECPQCAFLHYTNAATVVDFLRGQKHD